MAQAISDLKEYYPGSYFDLIKPYRDPSISNSFRLAVSQLKHDHYGTFEEKLDWIIDVIGEDGPRHPGGPEACAQGGGEATVVQGQGKV